jgi:quercetin dioxygenase-like cupin family protein
MFVARRTEAAWEAWRDGVETRLYVASTTGASQLTVFEQRCAPGHGAPTHLHAVEEVLQIVAGQADVWVSDERQSLTAGDAALIPAGSAHGFVNTGNDTLQVLAILAAPIFEAHYVDGFRDVRRWGG